MLPVECVLEQLDHVIADGVLRSKAFRPSQDLPFVESSLFDGEAECEAKRDRRLFRKGR